MTNHLTRAPVSERLLSLIRSAGANHSAEAELEFNRLALDLFALQFADVPAYQRFCINRGVRPTTVSHWTQIPAISTQAFKDFELTSLAPSERRRVFHSSGTTGQSPSRHFHSAESLRVYDASLLAWFRSHLLTETEVAKSRQPPLQLLALTPPPSAVPNSSLVHMFETIRNAFRFAASAFFGEINADGSWILNLPRLIGQLEEAERTSRPVLILGTAFSLVHLTDYLGPIGRLFTLAPGSRVMETGGYKGRSRAVPKAELETSIFERFGLAEGALVSEYGMSELSSQAYNRHVTFESRGECAGVTGVFRFPPWARARVISPETGKEVADGQTGLLQILDLANLYSVAALQTEDLAVRSGEGFTLAGRAARAEPRGCSLMFR